jgi:hypothetical protein
MQFVKTDLTAKQLLKKVGDVVGESVKIHWMDRCQTAAETLQKFFRGIAVVEKIGGQIFRCGSVGLRCAGRRSLFELWYFTASKTVYAVDMKDANYICTMTLNSQPKVVILKPVQENQI